MNYIDHKLEQAQRRVREAISLANRPSAQSLEQSTPALEEAITAMRSVSTRAQAASSPAAARLCSDLRRDLRLLRALLEQAASNVRGWAEVRTRLAGGYTPAGTTAALDTAPSIVVRG
jgi:hypothetical protein